MALDNKKITVSGWVVIGLAMFLGILVFLLIKACSPNKPNIIIIISDALRKDHLGCYGYKRNTSAHIDSFAKGATLFMNAFSQAPSTKPSIASLFTSKYPSQHNAINDEDALDEGRITLAEVLRGNGYESAGFIENSEMAREFQYCQGFNLWELDSTRHYSLISQPAEKFDNKIYTWLDKHHKKPFFLYVHYIDPHTPYNAPEPFNNYFKTDYDGEFPQEACANPGKYHTFFLNNKKALERLISLYDDEIRYVDSRFQKLISKLKQLNIFDKTIVIFTTDHGEGFLEHGWLQHSYSVCAELINVPLIIRYPKLFKKGKDEKYVQLIDIFPTITHILNINTDTLALEGKDILSEPEKQVKVFSEHLKREWGAVQECIIAGDWKLIHRIRSDTYRLFNIKKD